mmetsp:Transcript_8196/g.20944  ORF Transcript_8196/g.20944 Transcript_8196/m.20944 type:complete len:206 (-) Transcript_8196:1075-1692(-)
MLPLVAISGNKLPNITDSPCRRSTTSSSSLVSSSNQRVKLSRKPSPTESWRVSLVNAGGLARTSPAEPSAAACASGLMIGCGKGGRMSQRLSKGLPSAPAKSSSSMRCGGNKSRDHICNNTSKTIRHSGSRSSNKFCSTQGIKARRAICDFGVSTPVPEALTKYWHMTRTSPFTPSDWSKYALSRAMSWSPIIAWDATAASGTDS